MEKVHKKSSSDGKMQTKKLACQDCFFQHGDKLRNILAGMEDIATN